MKKFITAVLMLSVVFFSCNQAVKGEYATVVLDLDGSSSGGRAIGQNGLPYLHNTHITIEANGRIGGTFVKEFAPGEAGNIALRLIIGDTVRLRVKASNASGIWSGSTTFTVEDGTNAVFVKLNKIISGAQALTFSMTTSSSPTFNFTVGGKSLLPSFSGQGLPAFCRDGKGNIYIGNGNTLHFYTSEGDRSGTPTVVTGNIKQLVGDSKTGKVYLLDDNKKLYDVQAESPLSNWPSVSLSSAGFSTGDARIYLIAAHDGQLFVFGRQTPVDNGLYVYDIEYESNPTPPPLQRIKLTSVTNKEIAEPPSGITDMFVTDDAVYLLRSDYAPVPDQYGNVYSKGALIKYEYNKLTKTISGGTEFGASDNGTQNGIVLTPDTSFYRPLKFIGFDDDVLYIADDGVKFTYFNEAPRITANKNRIAAFNTSTNSLSFTDTSATWEKEEKILPQKTLLWKARTEENNTTVFDYYAVERANASLGVHPDIKSESKNDYYTDVFCFDQAGNLYVVKEESSDYKVMCYEPTADGSYDFANALTPPSNPFGTDKITAIAAGTIINGANEYNALYYCYEYTASNYRIKRIRWQTTQDFSAAATDSSWSEILEFSPVPLAANKDGLFVATNGTSGFSIKKFKHDGSLDVDMQSHDDVGTINALQIADGVLYAISTKQEISYHPDFFNISGKLLKLGETGDDFDDDFDIDDALMYGGNGVSASSNGSFAPYRFIAVKPKKLVIASDGAYGLEDKTSYNKNRVLIFTLDDSGDMVGDHPDLLIPDSRITFSKELRYNVDCGRFDWK